MPNVCRAAKLGSATAQAEDPVSRGGGHYNRGPSGAEMRLIYVFTRLEAPSRVPLPSFWLIQIWAADFPNGQCNNVCFFLVMPNFYFYWKGEGYLGAAHS